MTSRRPFPRAVFAAMYAEGYKVPPFQAAIDRIITAANGEVWLRRGAFGKDAAEWLLFGRDGRLSGNTLLSTAVDVMAATPDHLYGVQLTTDDVPTVVRLRIERRVR